MVPSGPPTPLGGAQSVPPSLLRSNSGMLGGQGGGPLPSQTGFPSLVSPRTQFNNMNMLGNVPNVSSLINQSFANGGPNMGLSGLGSSQRGDIDSGAESDPLSSIGGGVGFNAPSSFIPSNMVNPSTSGQVQGQQFSNASGNKLLPEQQQIQQHEPQNFQHTQQSMQQFSAPHSTQQVQQQQQFQSIRGGLPAVGPVKMEPQTTNDQHGSQQQQTQQLQSLRNLGQVKMEAQQLQNMRNLVPVKMEPQHSDQSLFLHQQQQQQQQQQQHQFLHMSRQSSQAAAAQMNLLNQQRILQLQQQHHQQQLLKTMPQQRSQLSQQQFQQHNLPLRSPAKPPYEPGMCARRLTHYMYQQQHRPEDNNIEFWRKFVAEYFAPHAKKKWCVSLYGSGRQTTGVFPQDVWHCEICNRKPGRGFEATVEVLPRLFKIKYESGTLEELLYVDMPREYHNTSGQIVLDYAKAIQESVFEQLRVVRDGQLRIVFSPELKICSWEFCARRHEELIPRRLLIPQVSQLGSAAQKYQAATQNASSNLSVPELQNNCNMFLSSARQLSKALEVPLVNDLGYTKRYVRCLQISEVVNSMKDLIDYSRDTGTGPMESLTKYPRRTSASSGFHNQAQQPEEQLQQRQQQTLAQNSNGDSGQANAMQLTAGNGIGGVNNPLNAASTSTPASTVAALIHQNSMNSRQQNSMNNASSPYGGNSVQIPSPGSSSTIPNVQPNPSPFQSPTPSSSNNLPQASHSALPATNHIGSTNSPANISLQQPALSGDADQGDSHSSVQKIIHEMMMSSQLNGTSGGIGGASLLGNDVKNVNGIIPTNNSAGLNGGNSLMGHGTVGNSGMGSAGYNTMGGGLGQSAMVNGLGSTMGNNSIVNGRIGLSAMVRDNQQQDLGNQLLSGLGAVNGFNNLQFDWKSSP
ncbi:SEUSS transcriptional co-regulator isoform 1 [Tripterygium wilfordii]|uniref:SEUSS transcriptional co-regulator isoform 1 n=1 Tax=Tripterygium wilfordii TaxID=458696 RepID=A0A7J7DSJ0_TRIWF|nr:transcriptional corepressor SEUSS-like [Tripterygium wilfordii]KAF5749096.1 SEUSS transcriptional co-regulator isoform 1 [Tripterygium wilfordii]